MVLGQYLGTILLFPFTVNMPCLIASVINSVNFFNLFKVFVIVKCFYLF